MCSKCCKLFEDEEAQECDVCQVPRFDDRGQPQAYFVQIPLDQCLTQFLQRMSLCCYGLCLLLTPLSGPSYWEDNKYASARFQRQAEGLLDVPCNLDGTPKYLEDWLDGEKAQKLFKKGALFAVRLPPILTFVQQDTSNPPVTYHCFSVRMVV